MLKLQSRSSRDKKTQQALEEGISRVRSMALIHQNLYQDDSNTGGIKIREYMNLLSQEIQETYKIDTQRIRLNVDIDDLILDVDIVVPIGLIVNELLTNSFKYAFPEDRSGEIAISLKLDRDKSLRLTYSDDGIGYDIESLDPKSFGLRLVRSFADRLDASYQLEGSKGSHATFIIGQYKIAA